MATKNTKELQEHLSGIEFDQGEVSKEGFVWKGPQEDGITFSLLNRFRACRERFRVHTLLGLRPRDRFKPALEFGNLWHCAEEHYAGCDTDVYDPLDYALRKLREYAQGLCKRYPYEQPKVQKWFKVCKLLFPHYVNYWSRNPDVVKGKVLETEEVFQVPYDVYGRTVLLRGKFDAVHLLPLRSESGRYLFVRDNKTTSDVDKAEYKEQLKDDFQTQLYLVALQQVPRYRKHKLGGILYNVIRRPLSGGKHSIRQKKSQTEGEYWKELEERFRDNKEDFFFRWKVEITQTELKRFEECTLKPMLDEVCTWYDLMLDRHNRGVSPFGPGHYQTPHGIYDPIEKSGKSEVDDFVLTGDTSGLERFTNLFPELSEE